MGVDLFTCENCHGVSTEYDEIWCEEEHQLCGCAMPEELGKAFGGGIVWDDLFGIITEDDNYNVIPRDEADKDKTEIIQKYLTSNDDYGIVLRKEHCPVCQRIKKNKQDPEYEEYLRLKIKFEEE